MADRGRPRSFEREDALRRAMMVFWQHGFEGATLGDLTAAMGINRASLYAAFGSKEALFKDAVALYDATEGAPIEAALTAAPSARAAVEDVLRHNARAYTRPEMPKGCLVILSSLLGTAENDEVRTFLHHNRASGEKALRRRIDQGIREGELPPGTDPARLAKFYTTVLQGLSIQARDGATLAELQEVVDAAMAAWPADPE